jgi:hypothetical protein
VGRSELAGSAHLELVPGVAQLRPKDAMFEAMLRGPVGRPWAEGRHGRGARTAGAPGTSL